MADKEPPPWLLGVFWFAVLVLVLGTIARAGHTGYLHSGNPPAADRVATAQAPLHRSAAPPSERTRRDRLNQPYRQGNTASRNSQRHIDAVLRDDAKIDGRGGQTMRPRQIDPGKRARKFHRTVLPYFTEGALALIVGIVLGFLTKLELIVVTAVSAVVGLLVFYLEWREYTHLPFSGLWEWAWATVFNPTEGKETLAAVGGKLSAVGLATVGFIAGMKG